MSEIIEIKVGDIARSFDFAPHNKEATGKNACFVQGEVMEIGRLIPHQSCDVYKIRCTIKVFSGEVIAEHEEFYFAPVNGTNIFGGGITDGVVKI